jgi:hypothetical protein
MRLDHAVRVHFVGGGQTTVWVHANERQSAKMCRPTGLVSSSGGARELRGYFGFPPSERESLSWRVLFLWERAPLSRRPKLSNQTDLAFRPKHIHLSQF